jgi:hypothetical protein
MDTKSKHQQFNKNRACLARRCNQQHPVESILPTGAMMWNNTCVHLPRQKERNTARIKWKNIQWTGYESPNIFITQKSLMGMS